MKAEKNLLIHSIIKMVSRTWFDSNTNLSGDRISERFGFKSFGDEVTSARREGYLNSSLDVIDNEVDW